MEHIREVHLENFGVCEIRKLWHALRREGIDFSCVQTARLMRLAGVNGKGKGPLTCGNSQAQGPNTRPDLVGRECQASGPNWLWEQTICMCEARSEPCIPRLSLTCFSAGLSAGSFPIRCVLRPHHRRHSTRRSDARRKQRGGFTAEDHGSR